MQGLEEIGLRPAAVSGASSGAVVAAFLAAGKSPAETLASLLEQDLRATFMDWHVPWRALGTITNRAGYTGALSADVAVMRLRAILGNLRIEACTEPKLALSVTNLTTGRSEIVTAGPLAEFVLASGALPGLFAAREINGARYWDGGIANPLPFEVWLEDAAIESIVVHSIVGPAARFRSEEGRRLTVGGALALSHQVIGDELCRWKVKAAEAAGKRVILLRTETPRSGRVTTRRAALAAADAGLATARANQALLSGLNR
jgi:predicted acylesterase/phospholipase RssA